MNIIVHCPSTLDTEFVAEDVYATCGSFGFCLNDKCISSFIILICVYNATIIFLPSTTMDPAFEREPISMPITVPR